MGIFKEWKAIITLKERNRVLERRIADLERTIEIIHEEYKTGPIHIHLIESIKKRDREYIVLEREFEKLKEWSKRIFEIGQRDISELVWIKFRYFNLLNDYKITEMNLVGVDKSLAFANNRFEQIREENAKLKKELEKYNNKKTVS
jgi:hypothetical protein